jgi:hypothetical protein
MTTGRANVSRHKRKTASGGTTTVRQHTRRQSYAEQADKLFDSRTPKARRRAWSYVALLGVSSVAWGITTVVWGIGEGIVVTSITLAALMLANNSKQLGRAWRNRPRYMGPAARMALFRYRAGQRAQRYLRTHPLTRRVYRKSAKRWDEYGRRYEVIGTGPAPAKRGQPRATTRRVVRGTRRVSELDALAQAQGWTTTHQRTR